MSNVKEIVSYPSDREILFSRVFDAPRALVWQAHVDPKHVAQWWGPQGFTNTVHEMDVKPGGVWRLTMHGPDGTDYPNRIEYIEVVPPSRLVYHHGDDANPEMFHVTTDFIEEGGKTRIVSRMTFKTAAECEGAKKYGIEGHESHGDSLDAYLKQMT